MQIEVNPDRIRALGSEGASAFYFVTNSRYVERFKIGEAKRYASAEIVAYDGDRPFTELFGATIRDDAHILTALPDCLLRSIEREVLGRRKLLIMACRSGPTTVEAIDHFIRAGESCDPQTQQAAGERFFGVCEGAAKLVLTNDRYDTSAEFKHLQPHYEWHEQYGGVDWGDQQVYPSGEIACFIVPLYIEQLDLDTRLELTGKLVVQGPSIVQSGPPSFVPADQQRIYEALVTAGENGVVLHIERGEVLQVTATDAASAPAATMLNTLMEVDSRYRRLYEIGFSMNADVAPWPGNCAMNEVAGGARGRVHIGLGMLPHTQYHLDLFCVGTSVYNERGEWIFGGSETSIKRKRSAVCPCTPT